MTICLWRQTTAHPPRQGWGDMGLDWGFAALLLPRLFQGFGKGNIKTSASGEFLRAADYLQNPRALISCLGGERSVLLSPYL